MDDYYEARAPDEPRHETRSEPTVVDAQFTSDSPPGGAPAAPTGRRRVRLPILLFVATCLTTWWAGLHTPPPTSGAIPLLLHGLKYAAPVMLILVCHEAGHFLQARRYGVLTSYPFFIPMPIGPLGTFGAVIGMGSKMPSRRALFDIGITGPLAGLVPTLIFCAIGLSLAKPVEVTPEGTLYGDPLLLLWMAKLLMPPIPQGQEILLNPYLFAGWFGLLITALNLIPVGQLDGGHVLYALLRNKARYIATFLLMAAATLVIWQFKRYFGWSLMVMLLMLMGPLHPPTADDDIPLGVVRTVLGWLTMAFIPIGFTPTPFIR